MTDRPILFSGPMVRALLDGRKTQTRRLAWRPDRNFQDSYGLPDSKAVTPTIWQRVRPGDKLWVRETWAEVNDPCRAVYRVDLGNPEDWRWTPSIFMPRKFSRLTLVVTATKMEGVQDISFRDARAEACTFRQFDLYGADQKRRDVLGRSKFSILWQSLHNKPGTRWCDNPEVVALTFTAHKANIDQMEAA